MENFKIKRENKFNFIIILILIVLSISIISAEGSSGNLAPVNNPPASGTGDAASSGTSGQTQNPLQQTMDSSKGVDWSKTEGGGQRATFSGGNNQLSYNVGEKSYSLEGVKVPEKGSSFSQGYVDFDKSGKPVNANYQMGDKGSAQVFGKTEAYVPANSKVELKGENAKISVPEKNDGIKGEPKTITKEGSDVKVHYDISGKTQFTDDKGTKQFELKKGDEISHDGKNWMVEPGKIITPTTPNGEAKIPVGEDKAAAKFYPDGKIPADEKGSAVAISKDGKISVQGSQVESSPKVEISDKEKGRYVSLQVGKGSSVEYSIDPKTSLPVIKPSGNSWTVIDGKIEYKGINGVVYTNKLTNPPAGMSREDFEKIKSSQGMEIIPVNDNGKSSFVDDKGNGYKIRVDPNNPKGFDVVDINQVNPPRVSYGTNPPNPSGQIAQNGQSKYTWENPYGFDLKKTPNYNQFWGRETTFITKNFIVNAPGGGAKAYAAALEYWRYKNGVAVNGQGFGPWAQPAVINIQAGQNLGAGGATTFNFRNGEVYGWRMSIQGSPQRLLDSVIPHETNHMAFASEFRQPLPRWADEGSASMLEHSSELNKNHNMLYQFLRTGRGISFNDMFAMTEYPRDILPIYAQGLATREYLELQKPGEFINTAREALNLQNQRNRDTNQPIYDIRTAWEIAIKNHYGFQNLNLLQEQWNDWVRQGMPKK